MIGARLVSATRLGTCARGPCLRLRPVRPLTLDENSGIDGWAYGRTRVLNWGNVKGDLGLTVRL